MDSEREIVEDRPGRRLGRFIGLSVVLHVAITAALAVFLSLPVAQPRPPRGEPLIVELETPDERAPQGNPAMRDPGPPAPPVPASKPAPPARAERPAPKAAPARPSPLVTAPPRVAAAPPPTPERREPPKSTEPAPKSPDPEPAAKAPAPAPAAPAPPAPASPPVTAQPPSPESAGAPRVAAVPPTPGGPGGERAAPGRTAPDLRALRGGSGAGSLTGGRGGIEGEPIPLDSTDPRLADYLQRIKRMIEKHWAWPCMKNAGSPECDYRSAQLLVEFGILKDGKLQFIELRRTSGVTPYDDSALTAIKLASPFPEVPRAMMEKARAGSTGVPIVAHFIYHYEVSVRTLLR